MLSRMSIRVTPGRQTGSRRAQPAGFVYSRSRVVEAALFFTALYVV
jgi:hypothetical protein